MAFNKSKALEEAARLVSQRKLPQAIKQYQAVIEQDPQDLPLRNIVGDLLVREGNVREAVREFNILAEAYTHEGFTLKAIAIYKKIVKLDADSPDPFLRLAELYAAQKFSHEANEQYAQALAICERRSLHDQAGQILRKLAVRDPGNATYQMRLAEFLQKNGQPQDACAVFMQAAETTAQHKNISAATSALKRAAELEPGNPKVALFRARLAAEAKDYAEVERLLRAAPGLASEASARRMLLGAYLNSSRFEDATALAVEAFRASTEGLDAVRQFAAFCLESAPDAAAPPVLHHFGHLLGEAADTAFQRHQAGEILELMQQVLARHPPDAAMLDLATALCERAGEGRAPKALLETLGLSKSGERAKDEPTVLGGTIETPKLALSAEPVAHEVMPPAAAGESEAEARSPEAIEVDFSSEWATFAATHITSPTETEVSLSPASAPEAVPAPPQEIAATPLMPAESTLSPVPVDEFLSASQEPATGPGAPHGAPELSEDALVPPFDGRHSDPLAVILSGAKDLDVGAQGELRRESEEHGKPVEPDEVELSGSFADELAQVRFYLNSGFVGEAGAMINDLAQRYPGHSEILELKQQLESAEVEAEEPAAVEESEAATEFVGFGASSSENVPAAAEAIENKIVPLFPEHQAPDVLPDNMEESLALPDEPAKPGTVFQPGSLLDDLAQELAMALEETGAQGAGNGSGQLSHDQAGRSLFDASLEDLLTELEPGQTSAPATETPQTHYNLGVAFREMGLLDEAIGEFQKVVKGRVPADLSPRFLEASSMLGNCFMEKQMPQIAVRWYSRALQVPGLQEEIALALTYDLASACEQSGDLKGAQERFAEVYSLNIDYRDVAEKIQLLSRSRPA